MNAFAVVSDSGKFLYRRRAFSLLQLASPFPQFVSAHLPSISEVRQGGICPSRYRHKGLLQAVETAVEMVQNGHNGIPVPDYIDENVSDKVVKIIQSYTNIVNCMVPISIDR